MEEARFNMTTDNRPAGKKIFATFMQVHARGHLHSFEDQIH